MDGISALVKETPESPLTPPMHKVEEGSLQTGKWAFPRC